MPTKKRKVSFQDEVETFKIPKVESKPKGEGQEKSDVVADQTPVKRYVTCGQSGKFGSPSCCFLLQTNTLAQCHFVAIVNQAIPGSHWISVLDGTKIPCLLLTLKRTRQRPS